MSVDTVTNPVRDAIAEGHKQWHQAIQIGRAKGEWPADMVTWDLDKGKQDLYRSAGIALLMTRAEIDARYTYKEEGPFSMDWEEGEDFEMVLVPLARADYCGYTLSLYPRRHPLPGAVYVARQPIEGEAFGVDGMGRALHAIVEAHRDYPQELRINHTHYIDYLNAMHDVQPLWAGVYLGPVDLHNPHPQAHFNGIPINPQRRAPLMTLLAVYPLPGV